MQPISKFIFCSLNITVKMLIMTKVGQKIVGYIRKAYFDANFSFATYTLQVSLLFAYINSQLSDTMEYESPVGPSHFPLPTSHFLLPTSHFLLPTS